MVIGNGTMPDDLGVCNQGGVSTGWCGKLLPRFRRPTKPGRLLIRAVSLAGYQYRNFVAVPYDNPWKWPEADWPHRRPGGPWTRKHPWIRFWAFTAVEFYYTGQSDVIDPHVQEAAMTAATIDAVDYVAQTVTWTLSGIYVPEGCDHTMIFVYHVSDRTPSGVDSSRHTRLMEALIPPPGANYSIQHTTPAKYRMGKGRAQRIYVRMRNDRLYLEYLVGD